MKKKQLRMLMIVFMTAVITVGCSLKETLRGNDTETGNSGGEEIVLPGDDGEPVLPQEGSVPADGEQTTVVPPQAEGSPESPSENEPIEEPSIQTGNTDRTLLPIYRTRHVYGGILSMLAAAYELPDMEIEKQSLYDGMYSMSENWFAVTDVDGDGREELIISYTTSSMAGMFEVVYGYHPDTMELTREILDFTDMTFYDNGIVIVLASHNHTMGIDFWPYTMYQYNPQTDQYDFMASVSAWDKAYSDTSYDGTAFPEALDQDGDGVVYEVQTDPAWTAGPDRYDGDDFNAWISQHMNGASAVQFEHHPVVSDQFKQYTTQHLALLHGIAEESAPVKQTDIGWIYIQQGSLEEAERFLTEHYAVEWKKNPEFEDEHTGSVGGTEAFKMIHMDGGILSYIGSQVKDVTIFGIYPGMNADTAVTTLTAYGFYPKDNLENYMITGDGVGNAAVSYKVSNGVITSISVSAYCSYAG